MATSKRNYSQTTRRVLDIQSLNQCAYPGCTNPLVEPSTEQSSPVVIGHICHIYAISPSGPRWQEGITERELNSPENLILLCPNHHVVVDCQPETYTAELLKQWKEDHEAEVNSQHPVGLDIIRELVDQKIKDETDILRKSRFFAEFDSVRFSLELSRKLIEGELSVGTNMVRCRALAWCVRILSTEKLGKAEEYLKYVKKLGTCEEIDIADAFISSQKGDKNTALSALAGIDSPMCRSAAFMIVKHHEGPQGAIDWLKSAEVDISDLDSDGKFSLLAEQLDRADWETTQKCLGMLTDDDLHDTPVLHHVIAMTHLMSTVPDEFHPVVLNQLPFRAAHFPLASDATAIEARRIARRYFIKVQKVAHQLGLPYTATIADEYALWLELRDPDESNKGQERLESKLRDLKSALHFVRLGIEFEINLDLDAVEREIRREVALNGGITLDTALARFALSFTQTTPEDVANYIAQHRDELAGYIDKKTILSLQIDLFSQAGQLEKANECLDILLKEGLSEVEKSQLRRMIATAKGTNPVESLREQFEETGSISDLTNLVGELENRGDCEGLCKYSEILFEETSALHDAERFAFALHKIQRNGRLVEFLESNNTLVAQSDKLQRLYCWTLYLEGKLLKTHSELEKLSDDWNDENYRKLWVDLAISLGDWDSLFAFVTKECQEKDKRNAQELITASQLALRLDSISHAKKLIFAAAEKGKDDAGVLGAAYLLAVRAGCEDQEIYQWVRQATELSGDDGPIWQVPLKEFWGQKQKWDRQVSEIWQMLIRGDLPIFLAAQSLNKSLCDLMLFPALANLLESDPRRRGIVPAYSGQRKPLPLDNNRQIGIDATALLTLSFLNLLDDVLDAFDTVHLPHSTLNWLFEEKQRVPFHQPSQIKDAVQISHLLTNGVLEKISPSTVPDSDLSAQVGNDLALFIAEAEKGRRENDSRHIVVQPSPVHRIGFLMEEEADLTEHATVLSSCQFIVDTLQQGGQITKNEAQKARTYLQFQEKPWPNQPAIADGAVLYLDDMAVKYFLHLGILEKLKAAGFKSVVSPRLVSETDQLISYERISGEAKIAIERIRSAVNSRIESKKIRVGRLTNTDPSANKSISEHPTAGVFSLAKDCDAIITDDRCINRYSNIGDNDVTTPIFSTLDLIDALVSTGAKTNKERLEYRTRLRRAGYIFIPVSEDELAHHLNASTVENDRVVETAELKAIRENILRVRMTTWLQLPEEAPWLDTSLISFIWAMKGLWKADADFSNVRVRSDWIIDQIDIRGWAHSYGTESGADIVNIGRSAHIMVLLTPPIKEPQQVKKEYWDWVEDRVLKPIKEQYSDLYLELVEWHRRWIAESVDIDLTAERNNNE